MEAQQQQTHQTPKKNYEASCFWLVMERIFDITIASFILYRFVSFLFFMWSFDSSQTTTDLVYNCSGTHTHTRTHHMKLSILQYWHIVCEQRFSMTNGTSQHFQTAIYSFLKGLYVINPLLRKNVIAKAKQRSMRKKPV